MKHGTFSALRFPTIPLFKDLHAIYQKEISTLTVHFSGRAAPLSRRQGDPKRGAGKRCRNGHRESRQRTRPRNVRPLDLQRIHRCESGRIESGESKRRARTCAGGSWKMRGHALRRERRKLGVVGDYCGFSAAVPGSPPGASSNPCSKTAFCISIVSVARCCSTWPTAR